MYNLGNGQLVHVAEDIQHKDKCNQFETLYYDYAQMCKTTIIVIYKHTGCFLLVLPLSSFSNIDPFNKIL